MEFKILFNDGKAEIFNDKNEKLSYAEFLQMLKDSDYDKGHKIVFYTSNNSRIYLETCEGYGTTLYKINVDARFMGYYDVNTNASLELKFDMENINYHAYGIGASGFTNYSAFDNDVIHDVIEFWWEKAFYYRENGDFENMFNSILEIEFQRAIDYRTHNFSRIKEQLLTYRQMFLIEKKQIDDKLEHNSLLLSKLEDEKNKGLRIK